MKALSLLRGVPMQSGRRGNLPYVIARNGVTKQSLPGRARLPCGDCFASPAMTRGARNDRTQS